MLKENYIWLLLTWTAGTAWSIREGTQSEIFCMHREWLQISYAVNMPNDHLVRLFVSRHSSARGNGVMLHWPRAGFGLEILVAPRESAVVVSQNFPIPTPSPCTSYHIIPNTSHFSLLSAERKMVCAPAETLRYMLWLGPAHTKI